MFLWALVTHTEENLAWSLPHAIKNVKSCKKNKNVKNQFPVGHSCLWKPKGKSQKPLGKSRRRISFDDHALGKIWTHQANTVKRKTDRMYTKSKNWSSRNTTKEVKWQPMFWERELQPSLADKGLCPSYGKKAWETIGKRYLTENGQETWQALHKREFPNSQSQHKAYQRTGSRG